MLKSCCGMNAAFEANASSTGSDVPALAKYRLLAPLSRCSPALDAPTSCDMPAAFTPKSVQVVPLLDCHTLYPLITYATPLKLTAFFHALASGKNVGESLAHDFPSVIDEP